jgi:hypothetical protein
MLEQLFNLIKNESETEITTNTAIPDEHNNHAVGLATDSIFGGLQGALANGGLKNVLGMFAGGGSGSSLTNNPIVGGMVSNLVGGLMSKFGMNNGIASSIASSIIPKVLGKLINKTNDDGDSSFNINGIIGALTGGNAQQGGGVSLPGLQDHPQASAGGIDFGGILKNLAGGGLDANHDGHLGLDDLSGAISGIVGGKMQNQQQQSGGGIMDMLKGFIGG